MEAVRSDPGDPIGVAGLAPEGVPDRAGEAVDLAVSMSWVDPPAGQRSVRERHLLGLHECELDGEDGRRTVVALGAGGLSPNGGGEVGPGVERHLAAAGRLRHTAVAGALAAPRARQELLDLLGDPVIVGVANHEAPRTARGVRLRGLRLVGHESSGEGCAAVRRRPCSGVLAPRIPGPAQPGGRWGGGL